MESDHVTAGRTVVLDLTTDPDAVGITLGRFSEIERGEGPPATEEERAHIEQWKRTPFAIELKRQFDEAAPTIREGERIYEHASPHQRRRLGNMTHREVVAWYRAVAVSGQQRASAAPRPRERRFRRSRSSSSSRGDPDPDPEPLEVVPVARFLRDVRRSLEGAA